MRVIVMFDLPVTESENRTEYARFRKHLLKNGFFMMQESIYCKLALNNTAVEAIMANLRKNKPTEGLIQVFCITEKQYARAEFILGEMKTEVLNTDERLVEL